MQKSNAMVSSGRFQFTFHFHARRSYISLLPVMPTSAAPLQLPLSHLVASMFLFLLFQCVAPQGSTFYSATERKALLDLRSTLGLKSRDWPIKGNHCINWTGIVCLGGRVVGITISGLKRTRLGRVNPQFAIDGVRKLLFLETFNASGFSLPGPVPEWLGFGMPSLQVLDLRSCSVTGALPGSVGNLSMLKSLYLSDNSITGSLNPELGGLRLLSVLDIGRNFLTGLIPASFSSLSSLTMLDLSSNFLTGLIPASFSSLSSLTMLDLSSNFFTGSVPPSLGNLSRLQFLNLSNNSLMRSIPGELGNLSWLVKLDLGKNSFTGALPEGLFSSLLNLEFLDLSQNKLDGALPYGSWSMTRLQLLDLSGNNFTGELSGFSSRGDFGPTMFNLSNNLLYGKLNYSLEIFNSIDLSGNYFQGEPPSAGRSNASLLARNCLRTLPGQRSLAECRLFYSNRSLVFDDFGSPAPTEALFPEHTLRSGRRRKFILIGVFSGLGFIVILVSILVLVMAKHKRGVSTQTGASEMGPAPQGDPKTTGGRPSVISSVGDTYTYEQLVRATANFSEMNLIKHGHSGQLYRGILEGGTTVIVKRVDVNMFDRESCAAELEVLGKISHLRFVTLLGHCYEHEHEKLLVYKYMPNRDLATSFYRASISEDDGIRSLDWITRLKIATGVAEGLSYLHHECNPPLVHGDVQAGSILLDDQFEVRLGSLSNACAQEWDPHSNVITRILRTQTSLQGFPGSSISTCAYDVFCFGKVLLELVTGKLGLSNSEDSSMREWLDHTLTYISSGDKELVMKIMDPSLIVNDDLTDEVWAMAIIARTCLYPRPSKRPPMTQILKALENPLKVIRENSHGLPKLQTTGSSRSWNFRVFGSRGKGSPENVEAGTGTSNNRFRQSVRTESQSSGRNDYSSSSHRQSSKEIFPEPVSTGDV